MRIRQIKPSWWLDKDLRANLSADAREFYIGLWMLADDAGWLEWDVTRIAAELYPYGTGSSGLLPLDPIEGREAAVRTWAKQLAAVDPAAPHLVVYPCGHARVPKITAHQRFGGRPVYTVQEAHARGCARVRAASPGVTVGNGRERNVTVATSDGAPEAPSEFSERMAALGAKP